MYGQHTNKSVRWSRFDKLIRTHCLFQMYVNIPQKLNICLKYGTHLIVFKSNQIVHKEITGRKQKIEFIY